MLDEFLLRLKKNEYCCCYCTTKIRKSRIRKNILGLAFLGGPLGGMAFWGALGPLGARVVDPKEGEA